MTTHSLFNALCDPFVADLFLRELNTHDLSIFVPLVASSAPRTYDWLFSQVLSKKIITDIDKIGKINNAVIKIPRGFKKIFARIPYIMRADSLLDYLHIYMNSIYKQYYCDGSVLTISGALLYACRTGWLILYSGIAQEITSDVIDFALYCGLNIAIDPSIKITEYIDNSGEVQPPKNYSIALADYRLDEELTNFLCFPNLVVYTATAQDFKDSFLYLRSRDPATIRSTVNAINNKVLVSRVNAKYVIIHFPCLNSVGMLPHIIPHILYGSSHEPPAMISYPNISNKDMWSRDVPLFRERSAIDP